MGARLDGRDNALNFLRLVLASAVIVGHAVHLGGIGPSRLLGISGLAVDGFFAISGFLIAGSRMRLPMGEFILRRSLRILPGFWVCLVVTAFVLAPIGAVLAGDDLVWSSALDFVQRNFFLTMHQWGIDHTLVDVPAPGEWNGSLWTLEFEFAAYVVSGLLLTLAVVRRHVRLVLPLLLVGVLALQPLAHGPLDVTTNEYLRLLRLGGCFLAGMAFWAWRDKLPARTDLMVLSAVWVVVVYLAFGDYWFDVLQPIPLAYLLLALGARLPVRIGSVNDVSYGVYIYAHPVEQILVIVGAAGLGVAGLATLTLLLTLPLAWASWLFVERPPMRAGSRRIKRRHRDLVPQLS